ncbi:hypothetical protein HFTV1-gp03 [Haloferax tailed virus 1]|uniref:Uncharacterized protein n=1 Tax=Haloferax tailed virus 1 TaxID=2507575 RepID=A0A410N6P7_HFTV1|nr:hypothetical protein M1M17_gp03 [Haloferax tailed virus 1]QAS68836.1 hypothetical protein HFTV1-gp03 [Haloferax tailed virus 1]
MSLKIRFRWAGVAFEASKQNGDSWLKVAKTTATGFVQGIKLEREGSVKVLARVVNNER